MKRYDNYKDSGVEWLNEIPKEWKLARMRYVCEISTGDKDTINKEENGDFPFYVRSKNIERISTYTYDEEAILTPGDGDICKIWHYINGKFECHQRVYKLANFNKVTGKFLYYFLMQNFEYEVFKLSAKSTVDSLRRPMFQNFPIAFGTIEEQTTIANYLDHKTSQIDHLITKKEQFIKLLEEERVAVINQAVTKGLNPNVPMKDSGVEWLGEIPSKWKRTRLKRLIDEIFLGLTAKVDYVENKEDGVAFIRAGNLFGGKLDLSDLKYISRKQHEKLTKFRQVQKGDVLVTKSGSIGVCAILDVDGEFSLYESVFAIRPTKELLLNEYLLLLMNSHLLKQQYTAEMVGMGVHHLNMGDMKNTIVPIPSIDEQKFILDAIKKRIDEIELVLIKIREELELLKEYKTALISEVVTGKVDVRNEILN